MISRKIVHTSVTRSSTRTVQALQHSIYIWNKMSKRVIQAGDPSIGITTGLSSQQEIAADPNMMVCVTHIRYKQYSKVFHYHRNEYRYQSTQKSEYMMASRIMFHHFAWLWYSERQTPTECNLQVFHTCLTKLQERQTKTRAGKNGLNSAISNS